MNKYAPKNIDKDEAQQLYTNGLSLRGLAEHYQCTLKTIQRLKLDTRTLKEARQLSHPVLTSKQLQEYSERARKNKLGGYRPHPNRGQRYNGVWFDSTWEVTVAKSLDENNIEWTRPASGFVWTDKGNKYYPDFYLPKYDVYLDPKNGYLQIKDKTKIEEAQKRNNIRVLVLGEEQLEWNTIACMV